MPLPMLKTSCAFSQSTTKLQAIGYSIRVRTLGRDHTTTFITLTSYSQCLCFPWLTDMRRFSISPILSLTCCVCRRLKHIIATPSSMCCHNTMFKPMILQNCTVSRHSSTNSVCVCHLQLPLWHLRCISGACEQQLRANSSNKSIFVCLTHGGHDSNSQTNLTKQCLVKQGTKNKSLLRFCSRFLHRIMSMNPQHQSLALFRKLLFPCSYHVLRFKSVKNSVGARTLKVVYFRLGVTADSVILAVVCS